MKDDSWSRAYYAHPLLDAGFNSWENNGDEVDGAGVNEPIWPEYRDLFVGLEVIMITAEMMDAFATECPDYVVPCQDDTITFAQEFETLVIRGRAA